MDLSRRFFVFGSVAAVAAAAIPILPGTLVRKGFLSPKFDFRRITSIAMGFSPQPPNMPELVRISIQRSLDQLPILSCEMNVRGNYLWRATLGEEIILVDRVLVISCDPAVDGCRVEIISDMERNPGKTSRLFCEVFEQSDGDFAPLFDPAPLDIRDAEWAA